MPDNPFTKHNLAKKSSSRSAFTTSELEKIFVAPEIVENEAMRYVCLLLLTTGARPNEICQLWTDDVDTDASPPSLRITANPARDQSLKNETSARLIYLHPLLVQAGFVDYLKRRKLGKAFDFGRPSDKTYSTYISEDFSKILKTLAVTGKTMYSFRHTVNNRLKRASVNQEVREDLLGHEGEGTNATDYSESHMAALLASQTSEILSYSEIGSLQAMVSKQPRTAPATRKVNRVRQ